MLLALVAAYCVSSVVGPREITSVRVPIQIEKGVLFVKASVDGSQPMLFVFDPGAGSYITRYAAAQLRPANKHELHVGTVTISEQLPLIPGDTGQLDPAHDRRLGQIAGTIGAELMQRFVIRIDYKRREMSLIPPSDFKPPRTEGLLLRIDNFGVPFIPAAVNGVSGPFELDVRAPVSMLFTPFAQSLGLRVPQTSKRRIDSVRLGRYTQANVLVWISNATDGKFAASKPLGLIGNDILAKYVLTIDYADGVAYLEQRTTHAAVESAAPWQRLP
jgi:hypothetical protein